MSRPQLEPPDPHRRLASNQQVTPGDHRDHVTRPDGVTARTAALAPSHPCPTSTFAPHPSMNDHSTMPIPETEDIRRFTDAIIASVEEAITEGGLPATDPQPRRRARMGHRHTLPSSSRVPESTPHALANRKPQLRCSHLPR